MTTDSLTVAPLVDTALDLAAKGYYVFPLLPRTKEPATGVGGFHNATRDERQILHWWDKTPDANVGIALGKSGAVVWDIDSKAGADPEDVLCELALDARDVSLVLTGRAPERDARHPNSLTDIRGAQIYFQGELKGSANLTVEGTEIRGSQHYVVAPGSVHPSGVPYEGTLPPVAELPTVPQWLRDMYVTSNGHGSAAPIEPVIVRGAGRNNTLASLAGSMRRRGLENGEIFEMLQTVNRSRCRPLLGDDEVRVIAESISRYDPAVAVPKSDLDTAQLFAADHGDRFRHVRDQRMWLAWDGTRWRRDATGEAQRAAKETAYALLGRAGAIKDPDEAKAAAKWALSARSEHRIRALLALAETELEIAITPDMLDADPWLLTCANGTLDLRTGKMREHEPEDLISLGTAVAYDPDARCARWERFLGEIFGADEDLIGFVHRLVGYMLTGDTRERVLVVLHGSGFNGKSTFLETVKVLLGDFAATASFDSFTRTRGDRGPRNDLARLHRARLVIASESGEGRRLDEAVVKQLTGRDTIAARFLYGEHFEFVPQFKLVLATNHRPRVDGADDAIWDRLRLVPVEQSFRGREDKGLQEALAGELPGILAWAVRGCLQWGSEGLGTAAAVTHATEEYRRDEDVLGGFLAERCKSDGETATTDLRRAYEEFCEDAGERPLGASALGRHLSRRGIHREQRTDGARGHVYRPISLLDEQSEPDKPA
jgi:putative DNA primase/helicase